MEFRSSEMKEVSGEVAREKQFENKLGSDHARHSVDRNGQNLREFTYELSLLSEGWEKPNKYWDPNTMYFLYLLPLTIAKSLRGYHPHHIHH